MASLLPREWFHGSPFKLTHLDPGSTITPQRELARVFSHKPSIVSIADDGAIKHDGTQPGYLYRVMDVKPGDVYEHPLSSMPAGKEWLTTRRLPLQLVGSTEVDREELLSPAEVSELEQRSESVQQTSA
jgi:hypothetical protein